MEFDKSKCYSALDADELKPGDKVIVANCMTILREFVRNGEYIGVIKEICSEENEERFLIENDTMYALAYLVERKDNCLKCKKCEVISDKSMHCDWVGTGPITSARVEKCNHYEPKAEKHYRPFRDTDELIKVWCEKGGKWQKRELTMPLIWVRCKANGDRTSVTGYTCNEVLISECWVSLEALFGSWEFLDGSPCGVEA